MPLFDFVMSQEYQRQKKSVDLRKIIPFYGTSFLSRGRIFLDQNSHLPTTQPHSFSYGIGARNPHGGGYSLNASIDPVSPLRFAGVNRCYDQHLRQAASSLHAFLLSFLPFAFANTASGVWAIWSRSGNGDYGNCRVQC